MIQIKKHMHTTKYALKWGSVTKICIPRNSSMYRYVDFPIFNTDGYGIFRYISKSVCGKKVRNIDLFSEDMKYIHCQKALFQTDRTILSDFLVFVVEFGVIRFFRQKSDKFLEVDTAVAIFLFRRRFLNVSSPGANSSEKINYFHPL